MKYRVTLEDGNAREVEVQEREDGLLLIVDGVAHPVDLYITGEGELLATVEDRPYTLRLNREGENLLVDMPGGRRVALVEEEAIWSLRQAAAKRRQGSSAKRGDELKSPIAGVILSLPVAEGAEVAAGDTVLVIEAMKMENPIGATRGGRLVRLFVKVGETVKAGQPLALFE